MPINAWNVHYVVNYNDHKTCVKESYKEITSIHESSKECCKSKYIGFRARDPNPHVGVGQKKRIFDSAYDILINITLVAMKVERIALVLEYRGYLVFSQGL